MKPIPASRTASRLLAELGDDGAAYCGGTELLLAMKLGLASYQHLVDLKRVHGLRGITALPSGGVHIGAASTHREIETSAVLQASYPEMSAMISMISVRSSPATKSRSTCSWRSPSRSSSAQPASVTASRT